jgi:uncharacterized protein YlzI (FlbEa/FlbD family)
MFIKLTNLAKGRTGDPLILNVNHITTVYEDHVEGGSLSTRVYVGISNMTFIVEEGLMEIFNKIKSLDP